MNEPLLMHKRHTMQQLSKYLNNLFFLKDFELPLQIEQRLLRKLHNKINIRHITVKIIQRN